MKPPIIEIAGPPQLYRGVDASFEAVITLPQPLAVTGVEARWIARDGWDGQNQGFAFTYTDDRLQLLGPTTLNEGTIRLPMTFRPPISQAPTHQNKPAWSVVTVQIVVRRRGFWRRTFEKAFAFQVGTLPPVALQRQLTTVRSSFRPREASIELSLATTQMVAGEVLLGSCAVFHVDDSRPRTILLSLRPRFVLRGHLRQVQQSMGSGGRAIEIVLPVGGAGQALPFRFLVPRNLVPSFHGTTHDLVWHFHAEYEGIQVSMPVLVVDVAAAHLATPLTMPPVADVRVAALFGALAGWSPSATRDGDAAIAIERSIGRDTLHLSYVYRGERGTFLVARVVYASLGIGLAVHPSSRLEKLFGKDIVVGVPEWDKAFHATARSEAQVRPMLEYAVPRLHGIAATMVQWTDRELVFEQAIGGLEARELDILEAALEAARNALDGGRALIPPPIAVDLEAWHALARRLDGVLAPGDLSITGRLGHVPVSLGLVFFEEQPIGVRAKAGNPEAASAAARAVRLRSASPRTDPHDAGEAVTEMLHRWPAEFADLEIVDGTATALYRSDSPTADRAHELVQALAAILTALDPGAGPYR